MKKTKEFQIDRNQITVDTVGLQALLSCGRSSAVRIGLQASARVQIGRRVLWDVDKVRDYLKEIAE